MRTFLVLALFAVACSSSSSNDTNSTSTEQSNGGCPSVPAINKGIKEAGAACSTGDECKPVCCPCASGTKSWLAAACTGTCVSDACARTQDDARFCK